MAVLRSGKTTGVDQCPECGVHLDYEYTRRPNSAEPDHIVPFSQGGKNVPSNGRVICRRCNQRLGDKINKQRQRKIKQTVITLDFRAVEDDDDI